MDKKFTRIIIFYLIVLLVLLSSIFLNKTTRKISSLEVGQTWIYILNDDNPFEEKLIYEYKIIDIKKDYVLYIINNKDTVSDNKKWFVINCELKK